MNLNYQSHWMSLIMILIDRMSALKNIGMQRLRKVHTHLKRVIVIISSLDNALI